MKTQTILHLTSVETGGAGSFSKDINEILNNNGYESYLLYRGKKILYPSGKWHNVEQKSKLLFQKILRILSRKLFDKVSLDKKYLCLNLYERFTCHSAKDILKTIPIKPNVIFIHWASDFINAKIIYDLYHLTHAKINIIMIDNAPLTGGCHYPWDCKGYRNDCSNCPAINNKFLKNWNKRNLLFKTKYLKACNLNLITASTMDFQRAKESSLYKGKSIRQIYFPVDQEKYKPAIEINSILKTFSIETNKKIILIGSSFLYEERKGMNKFVESLQHIKNKNLFFLIAGDGNIEISNYENVFLGRLNESQLINAYQVADIYVCPSMEDSGPMMVLQSLMCGTPVVAFNQGYAMGILDSNNVGYNAILGDPVSLAMGIDYITSMNDNDYKSMSKKCRETAINLYSKKQFIEKIKSLL